MPETLPNSTSDPPSEAQPKPAGRKVYVGKQRIQRALGRILNTSQNERHVLEAAKLLMLLNKQVTADDLKAARITSDDAAVLGLSEPEAARKP